MAGTTVRGTSSSASDQSIGDLVSVAARDISQLVRYELELAKLELKTDAKRVGISAGLAVVALFAACLVLMLLCFAFAFGLHALHIWLWAAFLIVAGTCLLIIGLAALIAFRMIRKLDGMSMTRQSVAGSMSLLHRRKSRKSQVRAG
jgi:hypothetical protein